MTRFIGRDTLKAELRDKLLPDPSPSRKVVVLHGPAGIGKTELLNELFGKKGDDAFSKILWVDGSSRDGIITSLACVYPVVLPYPNVSGKSHPERLARIVLKWLGEETNTDWLLIFDGLAQYQDSGELGFDMEEFLPKCAHGSVLFTTRFDNVNMGEKMTMNKFSSDEAVELLQSSAKIQKESDTDLPPDTLRLVEELDMLPQAIATAGTYIARTGDSPSRYLELLQEVKDKESCDSLTATFALSYQELQRNDPLSAKLLTLIPFYNSQSVWFVLLSNALIFAERPVWLSEVTQSRETFSTAIEPLLDLSLLRYKPNSRAYLMFPALRTWLKSRTPPDEATEYIKLVLRSIACSIPQPLNLGARLDQLHLFHQVDAIYDDLAGNPRIRDDPKLAALFKNLGHLCIDNDRLFGAEHFYQLALAGYKKEPGVDDYPIFDCMNNLGSVYEKLKRFDKAEDMFKQSFDGFSRVMGPDDPNTILCWDALGGVYEAQKRYDEAEQMYRRSLTGFQKKMGGYDQHTILAIDNLVGFYDGLKRPEEAEGVFEQLLRDYREEFGPEYSAAVDGVLRLNALVEDVKRLDEAKKLEPEVEAAVQGLGRRHGRTFVEMKNLAVVYFRHGKLDKAEQMFQHAVTGMEFAFGCRSWKTLEALFGLAVTRRLQGSYAVAEMEFRAIRDTRLEDAGPDDDLAQDAMEQVEELQAIKNGQTPDAAVERGLRNLRMMDRPSRIRSRL